MSRATPRRDALSPRPRSDRGEVAASLIFLPVVILAIMLAIHFSFVLHGRHVASAAAQDGLRAAQQKGSGSAEGRAAAQATLSLFNNVDASVNVAKGSDTVTVRIQGDVDTPFGDVFNDVYVVITGPAERFYFESERR